MSTPASHGLVTAPAYIALLALILTPYVVTVPIYVQMIGISCIVIFLGSVRASEREIARKTGDETTEPREVLSGFAVYRFPIVASCMLTGLFLAFKYLPKDWVSFFLTLMSTSLGVMTTASMFSSLITETKIVPKSMTKRYNLLDGFIEISPLDVVATVATIPFAVWYWKKKHWLPNNVLSTSLCLSAIENMALEDYKSAAVLLSGLFFYDIFWVFGSSKVFGDNVMVSVAKQFEGPIKLIFPRFVNAGPADTSMLGLGDIVIPGFFVALMLRYDESRLLKKMRSSERPIFFYTVLSFYFIGLASTYIALVVYKAAQPALLYLVPACLLSSLLLAAIYSEISDLVNYTEKEEETDEKDSSEPETSEQASSEGQATEKKEQ